MDDFNAVTPVVPSKLKDPADDVLSVPADSSPLIIEDDAKKEMRCNLTRPPDRDNELIPVAAIHGPPGILALLRARRDYSWFVVLGLRAIEVCMGPRGPQSLPVLKDCEPVAFSMRMLEMEMIDEIFLLMKEFAAITDVQRGGLAIVELLVMDDLEWRDEVARKGGAALLCEVAKQHKDNTSIMCQVMTCMSYLAAEDYIEIMLGQHDALEHICYVLGHKTKNVELVTRAILALLNLTVCESHVEELMDKGASALVLRVFIFHPQDVHAAIIACGVLANLSVSSEVRQVLVQEGVFQHVANAMKLDPKNSVLQVACLKAVVNYTANAEHCFAMEEKGIPDLVGQAQFDHASNAGVRKYGNYFFGHHTACPIL